MSDQSSVDQDEKLVLRMRKTPSTPTKRTKMGRVSSAQRRRGLFQPTSPASSTSSEGLGYMSPLSSSLESLHSIPSTSFSPNGRFETPVKPSTPGRNISVRSTLFSGLSLKSVRRSPRTSRKLISSPSVRQSMVALHDMINSEGETSPKSSRTPRSMFAKRLIAETNSSPSSVGTPPSQKKSGSNTLNQVIPASPTISTTATVEPITEGSFYGPPKTADPVISPPQPVAVENFYAPAAPQRSLVIDTLGVRKRLSLSDREASRRSFVSGAIKRKRSTSRSTSRTRKTNSLIPGVWHALKKPKKMKTASLKPRPIISPKDRIQSEKSINVLSQTASKKRGMFVEKPRKRVTGLKARRANFVDFEDSFPEPLIKRKKLPSSPVKDNEPDTSKKFMKYGASHRATFTLHNNVKLEFRNGEVRMKSPKKRAPVRTKKLYTPQYDSIDFTENDGENGGIKDNVDQIIQHLLEDTPTKTQQSPVQVEKISNAQLLSILESPTTKVALVDAAPGLVMTEVVNSPNFGLVENMSCLVLNEAQKGSARSGLGVTGSMVTASAQLLNEETNYPPSPLPNEDTENMTECPNSLFPIFDRTNWTGAALGDISNIRKEDRRKAPLVPDDQYLLDAGQKSIGVIKCKECGVIYQSGDFADEAAHYNVHNHIQELRFLGWKDERVVAAFGDGRIILVLASDPKPWQQKVEKVLGVVDAELGFAETTFTWTADKKVFLFVNNKQKQVVGCLVSEGCTVGYRMYPSIDGVDIDTCARDPSACKVGVSRIWTTLPFRRKGVATRLFKNLCRIAGDLDADDVAFSIPSPAGKLLARSVMGREDFKVYGFINSDKI